MNISGFCKVSISVLVAALAIQGAEATESGALNYQPGATSTFLGLFAPIPGIFYLNQTVISPSARVVDQNGKPIGPIEAGAEANASRFFVSYGGGILGGYLYSQLIVPVVNVETKAFGQKDSEFGVANVNVTPLILNWKLSDLQNFAVGFQVSTPLGSYSSRRAVNPALGYTSYQPTLAYRYNDPNGFTAGALTIFFLNTENGSNKYYSGMAQDTDFEVGWNFGKLKLSAAGFYANQFEGDRIAGQRVPGGNKYRAFNIGPAITYDFGPFIASVSYQHSIVAENTARSNLLFVSVALPLYLPPGAPPVPPGSDRALTTH